MNESIGVERIEMHKAFPCDDHTFLLYKEVLNNAIYKYCNNTVSKAKVLIKDSELMPNYVQNYDEKIIQYYKKNLFLWNFIIFIYLFTTTI